MLSKAPSVKMISSLLCFPVLVSWGSSLSSSSSVVHDNNISFSAGSGIHSIANRNRRSIIKSLLLNKSTSCLISGLLGSPVFISLGSSLVWSPSMVHNDNIGLSAVSSVSAIANWDWLSRSITLRKGVVSLPWVKVNNFFNFSAVSVVGSIANWDWRSSREISLLSKAWGSGISGLLSWPVFITFSGSLVRSSSSVHHNNISFGAVSSISTIANWDWLS